MEFVQRQMDCRLCLADKPLQSSHILPSFFLDYSGMEFPAGKSRLPQQFTQPVSTSPGQRHPRQQRGYYEKKHGIEQPMLCADCEGKLSRLEDYAKRFFYGGSKPIRIQLPLTDHGTFAADYSKMKLFQISLLWRSAEAGGLFFQRVKLPPSDRESLRLMLVNGDPGKSADFGCIMSRFHFPAQFPEFLGISNWSIEAAFMQPVTQEYGAMTSHAFIMGGFGWYFLTGPQLFPPKYSKSFLQENGELPIDSQDGVDFLREFARKMIEAGNLTEEDYLEAIQAKRS